MQETRQDLFVPVNIQIDTTSNGGTQQLYFATATQEDFLNRDATREFPSQTQTRGYNLAYKKEKKNVCSNGCSIICAAKSRRFGPFFQRFRLELPSPWHLRSQRLEYQDWLCWICNKQSWRIGCTRCCLLGEKKRSLCDCVPIVGSYTTAGFCTVLRVAKNVN